MDSMKRVALSTSVLRRRMMSNADRSEREARSEICTGTCTGGLEVLRVESTDSLEAIWFGIRGVKEVPVPTVSTDSTYSVIWYRVREVGNRR